jgi:hypothetical protein
MNPQDPLAQLHPLREPELIGWWPLAPGWWLLLALLSLALAGLAWYLLRRYRANAYRRQGLRQLAVIFSDYEASQDTQRCLQEVNVLLKSVALRSYARREVASATGMPWVEFLNRSCQGGAGFDSGFYRSLYSADPAGLDMTALHDSARRWIARHGVAA